jgi:hypothetical protein
MEMTSKQGNETKHTAKGRAKQTDMIMQREQKQQQAQSASLSHNSCRANLDGD